MIAQLKTENAALLVEINALEAQLGLGTSRSSRSTGLAPGEVDAKVEQLVTELKSKDEIISELGDKLNKNMTDYASLVCCAYIAL